MSLRGQGFPMQSFQYWNAILKPMLGRRQMGARECGIVVDVGPRAACRSGIFHGKLLETCDTRAGLGYSTLGAVEPHPLQQDRRDQPPPSTRLAEIFRLLQQS